MIFSDSPQQRALERMMTAVPRFRPKGGGIMVLHHFEYTAEMCDCRYCPYYRGKRKCTASRNTTSRTIIPQSSTPQPSAECRRKWQDGAESERSSRSARKPNKADTPANTH